MLRQLSLILLCVLVSAASLMASDACIPDEASYLSTGGVATHSNLLGDGNMWVGTFNATIDGNGPFEVYCIDFGTFICLESCYTQGPDPLADEIVWILNNYYPTVATEPNTLATVEERAMAVQLALWHFSDGLDISSGGSPTAVFDAARAIIAAAGSASVPATPTSISLVPMNSSGTVGTQHMVVATVLDQNNDPMENVTVDFLVTGANNTGGSELTNASGVATFSYTGLNPGTDTIVASVDFMIPVGMSWILEGCQTLVMGEEVDGRIEKSASMEWDDAVGVESHAWGAIKDLYRP